LSGSEGHAIISIVFARLSQDLKAQTLSDAGHHGVIQLPVPTALDKSSLNL